jgi:hypothetical protein
MDIEKFILCFSLGNLVFEFFKQLPHETRTSMRSTASFLKACTCLGGIGRKFPQIDALLAYVDGSRDWADLRKSQMQMVGSLLRDIYIDSGGRNATRNTHMSHNCVTNSNMAFTLFFTRFCLLSLSSLIFPHCLFFFSFKNKRRRYLN